VLHAQVAFDSASDAAYSDGWQAGDNGGFGFQPWNFDNDTLFPVEGIRDVNSSSPFNQVGTAWRLGLNYLSEGKDIVRVGRGLPAPLQVGQTLSIVMDPPSDTAFFDIETFRLNTGGGNICYGGEGCTPGTAPLTRFAWSFFNWTDFNEWGRWTASSIGPTSLFNVDKSPGEHPDFPAGAAGTDMGVQLDFTLTGDETYSLTVTPLDNPAAAFSGSGGLENAGTGPIDWIEFMHYGAESNDSFPTDWYIKSMQITGGPAGDNADFDDDGDVDGQDLLSWQRGVGQANPTLADGDADDDNDVDGADLTVWKEQFGPAAGAAAVSAATSCGCGGGSAALSAVPEPTSAGVAATAVAGLAAMALGRRRRTPK
jgi:hypothetical protein